MAQKQEYKVAMAYLRPPESDTTPGMSGTFEHIGIQFLKAAIEDVCCVKVVDGYAQNFRAPEVLERILAFDPNFVGFSPTVETVGDILALCARIKTGNPSVHLCLGGHHASLCAEAILKGEPNVDTIVMGGDGEQTLRELVLALKNGTAHENLLGVACKKEGAVIINQPRPVVQDLNEVRTPVRDTIAEISKTMWDGSVRMSTSRGCIYAHCTFCTVPDIYGPCWRAFSAERVLAEIDALYHKYDVKFLWISDDQFVNSRPDSVQRAKDIARGLIERQYNLFIRLMSRPDDFTCDPELIPLLRRAGWRVALVGFEAGNNHTLRRWKKGLTKDKNQRFAQLLRQHRVEIQAGFIMFDPTNSQVEIAENAEFLRDIGETRFLANLVRRLRMLPGTQIFRDYRAIGLVEDSFSYRSSSYDYRFEDELVGRFALWIDRVYMRNKRFDDTNWGLLNMHIPILIEKMEAANVPEHEVEKVRQVKVQTEARLNQLNYEFFRNGLAQLQGGKTYPSEAYERSLGETSDALAASFNDAYAKYGTRVNFPFKRVHFSHNGYTEVIF